MLNWAVLQSEGVYALNAHAFLPEYLSPQPKLYRPAIYTLPDELHYMRIVDVMGMFYPNTPASVTRTHTFLTSFQALAPVSIEQDTLQEAGLRLTDEAAKRIFTFADFNQEMDADKIESLYINHGWASRIIIAHERKGVRAEVEWRPMFWFIGPPQRMARVYLSGGNSFLM